ncbi:MAG: hemin ABC transporter substrate-binding protein [Bauldia sp.]
MMLLFSRRLWRRGAAAIAAVALTIAASTAARAQEGPQRVVSIGGVVTEILYALNLQDRIVAVDTTSVYPAEAMAEHPNVGYMRALSAEGVLALGPDLILALEGSGPPEVLDVLRNASVPVVTVPEGYTTEAIGEKIRVIAEVFGVEAEGEALAASIAEDIATVEAAVAAIAEPRRVMFVLSYAQGRLMAAGAGTAAHAIIGLAGGVNALTGFDGYTPVTDEAVTAAAPETVLAMANAGPDPVTGEALFVLPALVGTPAAANNAFLAIDGQFLLAFGPRTAAAIRELALALYPDLTIPAVD